MRIKVLIASHKIGAGHKALGDTFYEQLKKDRRFDVKHFIREGGAGDKFYSLYIKYPLFLQEAMSVPQELPFCDIQESIKTPHMFIQSYRILKDENPDIVLSTRFSQTQHFAVAKRILKLPTVIINAVPDYGAPSRKDYPFLNYFKPDYLFVMEKDSLYQAIKKFNIDKQKVKLLGIMTKKEFRDVKSRFKNKEEARKRIKVIFKHVDLYHNIDVSKGTVLVLGGSKASTKTFPLIREIAKSGNQIFNQAQYFVICGRNVKFYNKLIKLKKSDEDYKNIFPFPFLQTYQIALVMYGANFPILGSIAPTTINELLETECVPFLIHRYIFHEKPHIGYIQKNKIGLYKPNLHGCLNALENYLKMTPESIGKVIDRARNIRKSHKKYFENLPDFLTEIYLNNVR